MRSAVGIDIPSVAFDAFFVDAAIGRRFCIFHPAQGGQGARGAIVYVHPFAEEMNRSRRMAALQARAFAAAGYAVLQVDLHGCGDSSGDFGEANWDTWIDDVRNACTWLRTCVAAPLWLWGLRAGCIVASATAMRVDHLAGLLFWQPTLSGGQVLRQFLRLKVAGDMLSGDDGGGVDRLRAQLNRGESVEVAGYLLSPSLAVALENAELAVPRHVERIECLELSGRPDAELSAGLAAQLARWQAAGHQARGQVVVGPAFWQTPEIAECPALLAATAAAVLEARS